MCLVLRASYSSFVISLRISLNFYFDAFVRERSSTYWYCWNEWMHNSCWARQENQFRKSKFSQNFQGYLLAWMSWIRFNFNDISNRIWITTHFIFSTYSILYSVETDTDTATHISHTLMRVHQHIFNDTLNSNAKIFNYNNHQSSGKKMWFVGKAELSSLDWVCTCTCTYIFAYEIYVLHKLNATVWYGESWAVNPWKRIISNKK